MKRAFYALVVPITFLLSLLSFVPWTFTVGEPTARVRLIPSFTVLDHPGEEVTIACIVENAYNLSGLDIEISWDATYLNYESHTVTVPVEDYPTPIPPSPYGGVLHAPEIKLVDTVTSGTYYVAYGTLGPSFNGNGTVFVMTFMMVGHPQTFVDVNVHCEICDLAYIDCVCEDAVVRLLGWNVENHDLAVLEVSTSKNGCLPFPVVGQGYSTDVTVVVENQGEYLETFDIAVYANYTRVNTLHGFTLSQGSVEAFTVPLDTSGLVKGNWVVHAIVESTTDIETADNSMTNGAIFVTLPGDVDGDRDVDIFDIVRMADVYGVTIQDQRYDPNNDIDDDGYVDIFDIAAAAGNYGQSW